MLFIDKKGCMDASELLWILDDIANIKDTLPWQPFSADQRDKVGIIWLFDSRAATPPGSAAALLRYQPGARGALHLHPGYELIFVLEGTLETASGILHAGTLEVCTPGSVHSPSSVQGCVLLVVWEKPVIVQPPGKRNSLHMRSA